MKTMVFRVIVKIRSTGLYYQQNAKYDVR